MTTAYGEHIPVNIQKKHHVGPIKKDTKHIEWIQISDS